ncbi:hypothetical protein BGW36DRAFT_426895 [Talaromyces proteolyticus]|uniref:Uncharacterized protein n=1 Tax=Talaromyces proteolyticus TaxID=1131652 RepID=A0AAD4PXD6_9EURO|nr:uncharacterized protein BGW36DRAFT_426895 [Talaromyces proteolyticus]KAH8699222.1 hypothetical protein BGW36DRAFT_426895 [Talaromyces proteolyticus]
MELSAQIRHIPLQINQCRDAPSFLDWPDLRHIPTLPQPIPLEPVARVPQHPVHNTGGYERGGQIANLSALLAKGVRVNLKYGDGDCVCNWPGREAVSFALAAATKPAQNYSIMFNSAGYVPIVANTTYVGGVVRQAANLSFSRIYDAGYLVPEYQPETIFTLFTRIILGTDLSSGESVGAEDVFCEGGRGDV